MEELVADDGSILGDHQVRGPAASQRGLLGHHLDTRLERLVLLVDRRRRIDVADLLRVHPHLHALLQNRHAVDGDRQLLVIEAGADGDGELRGVGKLHIRAAVADHGVLARRHIAGLVAVGVALRGL